MFRTYMWSSSKIGDEIAMLQAAGALGRCGCRSTQRCFDPRHQLRQSQRLSTVVVGGEIEPTDPVRFRTSRGGHDD